MTKYVNVCARTGRTGKSAARKKCAGGRKGSAKRKVKSAFLLAALVLFSAALIAKPEKYIAKCAEGIALWAQCVLPALFPFMVVCALLANSGLAEKLSAPLARAGGVFKLPASAGIAFLMSVSSGYPAGSRTVSQFYTSGMCGKEACRKLACLCSTSGPLFLIGTVGVNMFSSPGDGAKLFAAHIAAVAAVGLAISLCGRKLNPGNRPALTEKGSDVLYESFYGSVSAALSAGAFIAFFYTAAAMIQDFYILYPVEKLLSVFAGEEVARAVCTGLVEMTGGCAVLAKCGGPLALPFAGFLVTFGGACVLLQQLSYLTKAGVRAAPFAAAKFAQGCLCFLILLLWQ